MNNNITTEHILEILTSSPWDGGEGRKMLFLNKRYYVFNNEHLLIDGGVIQYNETLDKIFIRNEDLRGEIFVTMKDENVHLKGTVFSKLAGVIHIHTLLKKYDKELPAPLSRVADVEKYLTTTDIYNILISNTQIDETFITNFEKNLHYFSAEQSLQIYIKLSQSYFKTMDRRLLESICFYFSSYAVHAKLYEEMFMFVFSIQTFYERGEITDKDLEFLIYRLEERLLDAYAWRSPVITTNMIHETLLYFRLVSPHLPTAKGCVEKLSSPSSATQQEHAYYLSLMKSNVKEFEEAIFRRVVAFFEMDFYLFKEAFNQGELLYIESASDVSDRNTLLALIEVLGNCESRSRDVHLLFIFLMTKQDERVKELTYNALYKCKEGFKTTLEQLTPKQKSLKHLLMQLFGL